MAFSNRQLSDRNRQAGALSGEEMTDRYQRIVHIDPRLALFDVSDQSIFKRSRQFQIRSPRSRLVVRSGPSRGAMHYIDNYLYRL